VGHRHERLVLDGLVERDAHVLVDARVEALADADDAVEHRAVRDGGVVDGDEAGLRELDAVDDDRLAVGLLVAHRHRRGRRHVRRVDDRAAVGRVRAVDAAAAGDELVDAVPVGVAVGHRGERRVVLDGGLEPDGDVLVVAGFEVRRRPDDAAERLAVRQ